MEFPTTCPLAVHPEMCSFRSLNVDDSLPRFSRDSSEKLFVHRRNPHFYSCADMCFVFTIQWTLCAENYVHSSHLIDCTISFVSMNGSGHSFVSLRDFITVENWPNFISLMHNPIILFFVEPQFVTMAQKILRSNDEHDSRTVEPWTIELQNKQSEIRHFCIYAHWCLKSVRAE